MKAFARVLAIAFVLSLLANPAAAQNVLANGTFDMGVGVLPWTQGTFSPLDALGDPNSGSVERTNDMTSLGNIAVLSECGR